VPAVNFNLQRQKYIAVYCSGAEVIPSQIWQKSVLLARNKIVMLSQNCQKSVLLA